MAGDSDCPDPPSMALFTPQALAVLPGAVNGTARVYVLAITGRRRVAVEWFDLFFAPTGPVMYWVGCTLLPPGPSAPRSLDVAPHAPMLTALPWARRVETQG